MNFGMREAVDVVFKATSPRTIGNTSFVTGEPVLYFDSAKTSTLEGEATTVYAQGGKGNPRLIAWEGDKVVTFMFEEALLSPLGISVLTGAGLIEAAEDSEVVMHRKAKVEGTVSTGVVTVDILDALEGLDLADEDVFGFIIDGNDEIIERLGKATDADDPEAITFATTAADGEVYVLVDFYVSVESGAKEINITANEFAGYYYIEGDTLFRRQSDGKDLPAQLVIPNAKIQSNFNFTMAGTGDPSTFSFTADAFPGMVKGSPYGRRVLSAIQILDGDVAVEEGTSGD